jgi:hypothetical protein
VDTEDKEIVEILVEADYIDLNLSDHRGLNPLSHTAGNGSLGIVRLLLKQFGVRVNAHSTEVVTYLHCGQHANQDITTW